MSTSIKRFFQFSKGEWVASIMLILIIICSYLIHFFYTKHCDSTFDISSFEKEIENFELAQWRVADSLLLVKQQREAEYQQRYQSKYQPKKYSNTYDKNRPKEKAYDNKNLEKEDNKYEKKEVSSYHIVKVKLNSCDTSAITKIPRFGLKRAMKIVEYRDRLGGFYAFGQLQEIYILKDIELAFLEKYFEIDTENIQKIDINRATYKELISHPYFDAYLVKSVIKYREKEGKIKSIQEFQQCTHAYEELLQKIEPYLFFGD